MPPKKKGGKKAQDDWEADLGETIPLANATESNDAAAAAADANGDDDATGGGGLMAMLRKNKEKRKKKGKIDEDFVEGEDLAASTPAEDIDSKAPQEATFDDEFALPAKKSKGAKAKPVGPKDEPPADDDVDADSGRVLTKAEKEKLKKEREKQRKKEQVCFT
jgi:translation initiation factor 5B